MGRTSRIVTLTALLSSATVLGGESAVAHPAAPVLAEPNKIAAGPDGNMWFTESLGIGRVTPAGVITEFSAAISADSGLFEGIAAGPDGNLWFTERVASSSRRWPSPHHSAPATGARLLRTSGGRATFAPLGKRGGKGG